MLVHGLQLYKDIQTIKTNAITSSNGIRLNSLNIFISLQYITPAQPRLATPSLPCIRAGHRHRSRRS